MDVVHKQVSLVQDEPSIKPWFSHGDIRNLEKINQQKQGWEYLTKVER
jgi:hypothetical protein